MVHQIINTIKEKAHEVNEYVLTFIIVMAILFFSLIA